MRRRQRGMSVLLAIAALVVLGGIAAWAVGLVEGAGAGQARLLALARAQRAAEAGVDWARYRVRVPAAALCAPVQTLVLPAPLTEFTVTVRCTASGPYSEGGASPRRYALSADACNQPAAGLCPSPAPAADYVQAHAEDFVVR